MKLRNSAIAALAFAGLASTAVEAANVTFSYDLAGVSQASGSFSYADGLTGVLGYGDLSSFSVTLSGVTYTLGDVAPLTDYVYFGYDTAAVAFVDSPPLSGFSGGGFIASLGAINSAGTFGFFFTPDLNNGSFGEYSTGNLSGQFDNITFGVVPEPASWALMIAGFGLVGAVARRRRTAVAA